MRILLKVGGAQLADPAGRRNLVRSVQQARLAGLEVVLVHGGGDQIRALSSRLGLKERYVEGLRVTDKDTAEVVLMVLAGLVNKELVAAFEAEGVRAVGLCGADGSTFSAVPESVRETDLGYVGAVLRADPSLVELLLAEEYVPLIATVAPLAKGEPGARERFYNVNADLAAAPLGKALGVQALLFLTDVPGVLDGEGHRIAEISPERCTELRERGVIRGGMIPKVAAALAALRDNPGALVKIAPAACESAVLAALDPETGTRFIAPENAREEASSEAWTSTF